MGLVLRLVHGVDRMFVYAHAAGGAERLVIDAALGLQELGHNVTIYTAHHDVTHCFEETRDGMIR